MRLFRCALAGVMIALLGGVAGAAGPAAAAATATVSNLSLFPATVPVDGVGDAIVSVQADIDEPHGVPTQVRAVVQGVGSARGSRRVVMIDLSEVAGTRNGTLATYRGAWLVASTRTGRWHLMTLSWYYAPGWGADVSPGAAQTEGLTVIGTHAPTATRQLIPSVVPYGARQWARYTVRRSDGRPLVGPYLLVHYCVDGVCRTPVLVSLDRRGQATVRLYSTSSTWCSLVLPSTALPGQEFEAWYLVGTRAQTCTTVSAVAPAAVRHGRAFTVRATVLPSTDSVVDLQRLVGHTWKPDGRGWPGTGGRATISDVSTVLGPQYFRLRASGGPEMVPTTSRPFVVIGSMR